MVCGGPVARSRVSRHTTQGPCRVGLSLKGSVWVTDVNRHSVRIPAEYRDKIRPNLGSSLNYLWKRILYLLNFFY